MANGDDLASLEDLIDNFGNLIKKSMEHVPDKQNLRFEREVLAHIARSTDAFIEFLKPICNRRWQPLEQNWQQLRAMAVAREKEMRRRELESPASQEDFQANLVWVAEHGTEEDLKLLERLQETSPYTSDEIRTLLDMASQRIRELIQATRAQLPATEERRLKRLIAKSERGVLTPKELDVYRMLAQRAEQINVTRAEALAELARRQDKPAHGVMEKVG